MGNYMKLITNLKVGVKKEWVSVQVFTANTVADPLI